MMRISKFTFPKSWLVICISTLALSYFFYYAILNIGEIPSLNWNWRSCLVMVLSVVLVVVGIIIGGIIWYTLLEDGGVKVSWVRVQIIFGIAQFGKYLPGNIGQHVGRALLAKNSGISAPIIFSTMLTEVLWGVAVAAGLSFVSIILFLDISVFGFKFEIQPFHVALLFLLLTVAPWVGVWILNRYFSSMLSRFLGEARLVVPSLTSAAVVAVLFILCFLILGLIVKLHAEFFFNTEAGNVIELACLFATAWLAGFLVPGAPGGLGVREAMMVLLFSPFMGAGVAVGLSITLRVATTFGDGVAFGFAVFMKRLSR